MPTTSETEVCNVALLYVGADRITSFDNDDSKRAAACRTLYPRLRDKLLSQFRWNFALTRHVFEGADTDGPEYGYTYAYTLPTDLLRLWETDLMGQWTVESGRLLTDEPTPGILYSRRVTTVSDFTDGFRGALELLLAANLAMTVVRDRQVRAQLMEEFGAAIVDAASTEAHEQRPPTTDSLTLIEPRFGGLPYIVLDSTPSAI